VGGAAGAAKVAATLLVDDVHRVGSALRTIEREGLVRLTKWSTGQPADWPCVRVAGDGPCYGAPRGHQQPVRVPMAVAPRGCIFCSGHARKGGFAVARFV
jgi:hypothetical protein